MLSYQGAPAFCLGEFEVGLEGSGPGMAGLCHHGDGGLEEMDGYHVQCLPNVLCQQQCLVPPRYSKRIRYFLGST